MSRPFSTKFLMGLENNNSRSLGIQLAKLCVKANLAAEHVASAIGVTRMTVHLWYRGKAIRGKNSKKIEQFMDIIEEALEEGKLPADSINGSRIFIKENVNIES
jgi:transcriptional regulator with XRE-family HTH domain